MVLHNPNKPTQAQPGLNIIRRLQDQEAKKEQLNAPRQNPSHQRVPACYLMVLTNSAVWSRSSQGTKRYNMFHWICNCQNPPSSATRLPKREMIKKGRSPSPLPFQTSANSIKQGQFISGYKHHKVSGEF
ncbi:hypothetical protein NC652_014233 [Populus alba x Populus x berolinensis]|nr:hypothetical protein NC652_014233 [Populus alba x Populus x berolinensis]